MLASLSNFLDEVGIELPALLMALNACRDYDKLTRTFGDYVCRNSRYLDTPSD